jgi:predicted nuclease with TOPRIM domain
MGELQVLQKQIMEQTEILKLLLGNQVAQKEEFQAEIRAIREELALVNEELASVKEENKKLQERLDDLTALVSAQSSPRQSYVEVARNPPTSQPSNIQTITSLNTTPSKLTDTPYTIDTSRVEEASD